MKHLLLTTIAAVVLVGCGESTVKSVDEISIDEILKGNSEASLGLMDEILKGNIEGVKQYLAAGAVVNEGVWIRAHGTSQLPLNLAVQEGHKEIVELIIAKGTDVNAKGGIGGGTPLHRAAMEGHNEIAELLIAKGANVNAKGGIGGGTPLHRAATKEIVELLITKGADVNARGDFGKTPLDWANDELADLLRKHGGKYGSIHTAAAGGDTEAVKEFLAAGTDVNAKDKWGLYKGQTPLNWATQRNHPATIPQPPTSFANTAARRVKN